MPEITTIKTSKAISIDHLASQVAFESLTLMKIGVDGYDCKFLQVPKSTIFRFLPIVFGELCEYSFNEQSDFIKGIFETLSSMGYEAYLEDETKVDEVEGILQLVGDNTSVNGVFIQKTKFHKHKEFAWLFAKGYQHNFKCMNLLLL